MPADTRVGFGVRQGLEEGTAAHSEMRNWEPDPRAGVGVKGGLECLPLNITEQGDLCGPGHLGSSSSLEFLGKRCSPPRPKVSTLQLKASWVVSIVSLQLSLQTLPQVSQRPN